MVDGDREGVILVTFLDEMDRNLQHQEILFKSIDPSQDGTKIDKPAGLIYPTNTEKG